MAKTVLIVDDSASVRVVVSTALRTEGFEVLEAEHGKDGLAKLDGRRVHLIITDINMPEMDGITFVTELRKIDAYKFVPVCVLTTEGQSDLIERGKKAGAKAWVVKPFVPSALVAAVHKLIA